MDIKGLTLDETAKKIKNYLPLFLQDKVKFQENYSLQFCEINHNIGQEYHKHFQDDDLVNVSEFYELAFSYQFDRLGYR